ncbi:MAG: hypothetical protein WCH98_18345 [Verrucomicrobiota bacterium]
MEIYSSSSLKQKTKGAQLRAGLPIFVRNKLVCPPARGTGLNRWLFGMAKQLHECRKPDEITLIIKEAVQPNQIRFGEIERAVLRSGRHFYGSVDPYFQDLVKWPEINLDHRAAVIRRPVNLNLLVNYSQEDCTSLDTESVVDRLFPDDPLLCCGWEVNSFTTENREEWRGQMSELQFIVPNPMSAKTGLTKNHKESPKCLDNTGPRKYLVIEQDIGTKDEQTTVLYHLGTVWPLVMIVDSGGISVQGWFSCEYIKEDVQREFMDYAVSLGAVSDTWIRCHFARMPGGRGSSEDAAVQKILRFSPQPLEGSI